MTATLLDTRALLWLLDGNAHGLMLQGTTNLLSTEPSKFPIHSEFGLGHSGFNQIVLD